MRSRKSSTRKETWVQGSLRPLYKMERLLRGLCSTQASGHPFCFSPLTYFSTLLYLAHALKAPKGDLHKERKPSHFHSCEFLCVLESPSKNNLRSVCRVMDILLGSKYLTEFLNLHQAISWPSPRATAKYRFDRAK